MDTLKKLIKLYYHLTVCLIAIKLKRAVPLKSFNSLVKHICRPLQGSDIRFASPKATELVVLNQMTNEVYLRIDYNRGKPIIWFNKHIDEPVVLNQFKVAKRFFKNTNHVYLVWENNQAIRYPNKMAYLYTLVSSERVSH